MTTAAQLVKAIAQEILVQASEAPIEADESNDIIFALNSFMFDLDANGVSLGYTEVTDLGNEITVPAGAIRGIVANVALEIAPQFGVPIPASLPQKARDGMDTLRRLGITLQPSSYGATLPIGSGNEYDYFNSHFYPDEQDQILSETNEDILLEDDT